ncbi:MAG: hypothetical protein IJY58_01340 [Alphaproteobacteria bacterium]|nr:hypothetical protein [Alphaproteobacteria bacterium]
MKKIILALITGILIVMGTTACSKKENPNADIVIFSQKTCPHCVHAKTFIDTELKKTIPNVSVQDYDIRASQKNYELFMHAVRRYKIDANRAGTPLFIVDDNVLMGWNDEIQSKLVEFVKQKKSAQ